MPLNRTWDPVTPINPHCFKQLLDSYDTDKTEYLVNGFLRGFSICSTSNYACQASRNSHFVEDNGPLLPPFYPGWVRHWQVYWSIRWVTLAKYVYFPFGCSPKEDPGSYHTIHDLSYSYDGVRSVNDGIDAAHSSVQYYSVADAIDILLSLEPGAFMCKSDISKAFRIIPIRQEDHHLLGFSFQGKYFFDTCLSMTCSSSCEIFEEFSTALQWILVNKCRVPHALHMVDDFFLMGQTRELA